MIRIRKGTIGTEFSTRITNRDDEDRIVTQSLLDNSKLYIIFKRPDGKELKKVAEARDPDNLTNTEIVYSQPLTGDQSSIFTQKGIWEYRAAVLYTDGRYFESYDSILFWVT